MTDKPFRRNTRKRPNAIHLLVTEGETEQTYFSKFGFEDTTHKLVVVRSKRSNAKGIVQSCINEIRDRGVFENKLDSAGIVLDLDNTKPEEISKLYETCQRKHIDMYLSNPCFEYWLILHFKKSQSCNPADLNNDLSMALQHKYDKVNDMNHFLDINKINKATKLAKNRLKTKEDLIIKCLEVCPSTTIFRIFEEKKLILK